MSLSTNISWVVCRATDYTLTYQAQVLCRLRPWSWVSCRYHSKPWYSPWRPPTATPQHSSILVSFARLLASRAQCGKVHIFHAEAFNAYEYISSNNQPDRKWLGGKSESDVEDTATKCVRAQVRNAVGRRHQKVWSPNYTTGGNADLEHSAKRR